MAEVAREFHLTGFCMPGKPGIICLEGDSDKCNEVWAVIKSWNWKKINVKHQETDRRDVLIRSGSTDSSVDDACSSMLDEWDFRKFKSFEEIGFVKGGETRDYHMDMGEFSKYLEQNNCLYMFKELFGFDKKPA